MTDVPARNRSRSVWMLLIGLLSVTGCGSSPTAPRVEVQRSEWNAPGNLDGQILTTSHYQVHTTTPDATLLEYVPIFMENAYRSYAELITPDPEPGELMKIYLFGTRPEWARFVQLNFPRQAHTYLHIHAGGFVDSRSSVAVIHDIGRDRTLSLLGHEGFHQYLQHETTARLPAWLNEGLACQWEAFDLDGRAPRFTPYRNYLRKNDLREAMRVPDGFIGVSELINMHAGQAVVKTGQYVRAYYAQVWSLVLFLRTTHRDELQHLLADASDQKLRHVISSYRATEDESHPSLTDNEIIFQHYIADDLQAFSQSYRAFVSKLID